MALYYKQCVLRKGNTIEVSWIPEVYAHVNAYVKIRDKKDKKIWDDGWQVMTVSEFRMDEAQLNDYSQDYKHQRKMSDI